MRISDWSSDVCSSDLLRIDRCYRRIGDNVTIWVIAARFLSFTDELGQKCPTPASLTPPGDLHRRMLPSLPALHASERVCYRVRFSGRYAHYTTANTALDSSGSEWKDHLHAWSAELW